LRRVSRNVLISLDMSSQKTVPGAIESKIFLIRGEKVMLDSDLAELYQVPTKRLNEQVTRNLDRFPADFMFSISNQELENLKSQIATSSSTWGGRRKPPRAFTEQGIAMLSSVLQSPRAVQVNIRIMRAFVQMRKILISTKEFETKLNRLESKYDRHDRELKIVFDVIRKLMSSQVIPHKRIIGLGKQDD
jgi:hypothetical protein